MISETPSQLSKAVIEEAILLAQNNDIPCWKDRIVQMDKRVERLSDQILAKPSVPTELQDSYRDEIDALTLENMQLQSKLDKTAQALERAKQAYKTEVRHTQSLKQKLDDLEQRLLGFLNKEF